MDIFFKNKTNLMKIINSLLTIGCLLFLTSCSFGQKETTIQEISEPSIEKTEPSQKDVVYIPDTIFKNYLLNNEEININGDDKIQITEAEAFTGRIYCFDMGILDLTGIEAFTSLTSLHCGLNKLTSLNITKNTALISLNCSLNQLTSLDVQNNTNLVELDCSQNKITALNVNNNTKLKELHCFVNKLTTLDVQKNTALQTLTCSTNQLTDLNLEKNIEIEMLVCNKNKITALDLSKNTSLTYLFCENNQLVSLNLKNNHNTQIERIRTDNNPNLRCIKVDDPTFSTTNWKGELFRFDVGLIFNKDCDWVILNHTSD